MRRLSITALKKAIAPHRAMVPEVLLWLAVVAVATLIAWAYDVLPNPPEVPTRDFIIETDEIFALALLICIGLLVLSWRFLLIQRREVARRIAAERRAREMALEDALTGLPNRRRFDDELKNALAALPGKDATHAVFMLDLTGFKHINDVYGHGIGDEVLINVAMRLRAAVRAGDLVARFGGDEFAILAQQLSGTEEVTNIALRVIKELEQPIATGPLLHHVGLGIGIALIPRDGTDAVEVLRKADIALYRAKSERESASRFYDQDMDARIRERDVIDRDLQAAIDNDAIQPRFQPLVDLKTKRVVGFEALPRWEHPTLGDIAPDRFVPIAESSGLIEELTDHLLRLAARAARQWPADVTLSFNISAVQLKDRDLGARILSILSEEGLPPQRLEIELTEAALVRDLEAAQKVLGMLGEAGVHIVVDDFGTGYSSLYHLRNLKFDKIKIGRTFIDRMEREPEAMALVRALLGFGQGLGLTVTADGVKEPDQVKMLQQNGCKQAQGYLFGEPMTAAATVPFIGAQQEEAAAQR